MSRDDVPSPMAWFEPDIDTAIKLSWTMAILGWLVAIVSAIGEILGWWDLIGELGMTVGAIVGVLTTLASVVLTSGRQQVQGLATEVRSVGKDVRGVGTAVHDNGQMLWTIDRKLDKLEKLDDLDVIQATLDEQTGVLDRQLAVLGQIRDRL